MYSLCIYNNLSVLGKHTWLEVNRGQTEVTLLSRLTYNNLCYVFLNIPWTHAVYFNHQATLLWLIIDISRLLPPSQRQTTCYDEITAGMLYFNDGHVLNAPRVHVIAELNESRYEDVSLSFT